MAPGLRIPASVAMVLVVTAAPADSQTAAAPNLSRNQRAALQAIVRAAASGAGVMDVPEHGWPVHVLRLSDGSHYIAFTVDAVPLTPAKRPLVLYVRLATHPASSAAANDERSGVAEWLAGQTAGPPPAKRGIDFGEMPTFGAGAIAARGPGPQSLQLLELERKRAQERRETDERERQAKLEGEATSRVARPFLPFEDFDLRAVPVAQTSDTMSFRRGLTAGPGDYDLLIGVADPEAKDVQASVRLVRRRLILPPASLRAFALSSVIVADAVRLRETPLSSAEQAAQPYTIGPLEITPARDRFFTNDESATLVVQVINAAAAPAGKPDVAVGFRLFRRTGDREEFVGTLTPHIYNETTLPPEFDVTKGHPLFDAVTIPLRTFKRGDYRVEIAGNDRAAGIGTTIDATFTVVATPAALLGEAPALAPAFRRQDLLQPAVLEHILVTLAGPRPSDALAEALASARAGRFAELIRDQPVAADESDARLLLRTLAMYAIGDQAASLTQSLQPAVQRNVAPAAVQTLLGAVRAIEGNDRNAVAAWEAAISAGGSAHALTPLVADALLRLGDATRALEAIERASAPNDPALQRRVAAARIALGRHVDALRVADALVLGDAADLDAHWLAIHALFAGFVQRQGPGSDPAGRARLRDLAQRYIAAKGPHAALAADWAAAAQ